MSAQTEAIRVERPERVRGGRTVLPFLGAFVVLLVVTLPRGLRSTVTAFNVPVLTWSGPALTAFKGSDAGSLLTAATSLQHNGHILPKVWWIYNLWPPGMVWVDRVLLEVQARLSIPIVLSMVILNCAVWSVLLGLVFVTLWRWRGLRVALIFGAAALLASGVTQWGTGSGLFYSDSFGAIAYCLSLLFVLYAWRAQTTRQRWTFAGAAGLFLAGSAYFRASFELVADATVVVAVIVAVILIAKGSGDRTARLGRRSVQTFLVLAVTGVAAQVFMLPWRAYAGLRIHVGDFRWSTVSDLTSAARWLPDSILLNEGAAFAAAGHSNWACIDAPAECKTIYKLEEASRLPYAAGPGGHFTGAQLDHLAVQSFFQHPFTFIFERIDALAFGFASNTGGAVKDLALPESILMVVVFIAAIVWLVRSRNGLNPAYLLFFFATVIQFGTIALIHMEPRYFLGIELSIIVITPFILGNRGRPEELSEAPPDTIATKPRQKGRDTG